MAIDGRLLLQLSLSLALVASGATAAPSPVPGPRAARARPGPDQVFVFLKTAPTEADLSPEARSEAFAGHFANMRRLSVEGWLAIAGPFAEPRVDPTHRGLFLFDGVELERGRELALTDPAVRAGVFEVEVHAFRTTAPVAMVPILALLAEERDPGRDPSVTSGVRAFVLAGSTDENAEERLAPLVASRHVLFHGRFVGSRGGELLAALDAETPEEARGLLGDLEGGAEGWTLYPWWSSEVLSELPRLAAAWSPAAPALAVEPLPETGRLATFRPGFARTVDVFGVPIVATANTPEDKLVHAAHVLAQYLDNDEDGRVDDPLVACALRESGAFLAMAATRDELEAAGLDERGEELARAGFLRGQDLYADETAPDGGFDASLEEVLHLVSFGYELAHPDAFAFRPGSRLAAAMDVARGGHFEELPAAYPAGAWYHYDDPTCDYGCQAAEYFYWALTTLLGAQSDPARARRIADEWELATPELLRARDEQVHRLLAESGFRLPTVLPDGSYGPAARPR